MEITKIESKFDTIKQIIQISDIHIRTLKRHKEYNQVFEKMFKYINTFDPAETIVVVTGDIVHSKLEMSPELITMLTDFFKGFNLETLVILGNHDLNLNNTSRLDAISPIINLVNNKNITFLLDNGLFEFRNVIFNHMDIQTKPDDFVSVRDVKFDKPIIGLHHGAVHTAKTDIGYEISNTHVKVNLFDGHDLVLLGDIHKADQTLQEYEAGVPTKPLVKYPGSLIQQNHGEGLVHGLLVWDIPTLSAKFVPIKNKYGYVTFVIKQGIIVEQPEFIPAYPRIRIKYDDTTAAQLKKIISILKSKFSVQDISVQRISGSSNDHITSQFVQGNIRDVEYQNQLLSEYVSETYPQVTDREIDAIRNINRTVNSKLPRLESVRNTTWHPVSFKFSNMFSYGENNEIDFSKLTNVVGLFAPNASGKSSLLDAITYTIFDKCSKTGKANDVLNTKSEEFKGEFTFRLNNDTYTIIRHGITQKSGHVKVNVEFFTESENLNGEERSETNKNIRKYLGTYDDFILTAFSLQADNNNFIEKSQRERKDLLSQFLDITIFEQLYVLAAEEIKETAGKIKEYKKTNFSEIIEDANKIISQNNDVIIELEQQENDLRKYVNEIQAEMLIHIESKQNVIYSGPDLETLKNTETQLTLDIEELIKTSDKYTDLISETKTKLKQLNSEYNNINIIETNELINQYTDLNSKLSDLVSLQKNIQRIIDEKSTKIQALSEHEYDPECTFCTSNIFVQQANDAADTINNDKDKLLIVNNEIKLVSNKLAEFEIDNLQNIKQIYDTLKVTKTNLTTTLSNYELNLELSDQSIQTKESELESCLEKQETYIQNEESIKHNAKLDYLINNIKQQVIITDNKIKTIVSKIKEMFGENEVAKTKKQHAIESLDKFHELEIEYRAYEYYLKSIKRNGIPYLIISRALPHIETEINNVLNHIVDFNIVLNTDGKNINGYIIYDDDNFWPLELTSGMERFISSLAIRVALINVSTLSRPNFIAIDEGWGSLDSEHISDVVNLFSYFRQKFDFSIIISHVDSMRDMVDMSLDISKQNNMSHIVT